MDIQTATAMAAIWNFLVVIVVWKLISKGYQLERTLGRTRRLVGGLASRIMELDPEVIKRKEIKVLIDGEEIVLRLYKEAEDE